MANGDSAKNCNTTYNGEAGYPTVYSYTPAGDITSITFGGYYTTESKIYSYDMAGRITTQLLPEETANEMFVYDTQVPGALRTYTDARGVVATYSVDTMYRLTSASFSDGTPTITNIYDSGTGSGLVGRLASADTANTVTWFNYNSMGRMFLKSTQAPMSYGGSSSNVQYGFDFASDVTSLADSSADKPPHLLFKFNRSSYRYNFFLLRSNWGHCADHTAWD